MPIYKPLSIDNIDRLKFSSLCLGSNFELPSLTSRGDSSCQVPDTAVVIIAPGVVYLWVLDAMQSSHQSAGSHSVWDMAARVPLIISSFCIVNGELCSCGQAMHNAVFREFCIMSMVCLLDSSYKRGYELIWEHMREKNLTWKLPESTINTEESSYTL